MISRLKFDIGDLIDKELSHIPTYVWESSSTTFCDLQMAGGQYIQKIGERARTFGHSDENIRKRVFGFSEKPFYLSYIKSNPSLIGTFDVYNENINMKFDVIVGNPPYQDTTANREVFNQLGNKKLWKLFLKKASELVKDDGFISFLVPQSSTKPTIFGELPVSIKNMGDVKVLNVDTDVDEYFKGINIKICSITFKKTKEDVKCLVNGIESDFNSKGFLTSNPILQSILTKILKGDNTIKVTRHSKEYSDTELSEIGGIWSSRFAYPQFSKTRLDGFELNWKSTKNKNDELLVLLKSNMFLKTAWDSFVILDKRWYHNFWTALGLHEDITTSTTEEELHELYGLTQEEKNYLNSKDMRHIG